MDIHFIQMHILRELLYKSKLKFKDLNIVDLGSNHLAYHVNGLQKMGLVQRAGTSYELTAKGKEFANQMDTDTAKIEKQPKVSVLIIPTQKFGRTKKFLIQTRLKEPYYGFSGFMTGKMRFGETVFEAASREFQEEMGLAADFLYGYLLHEMVYDKSGNLLEDKFFHVMVALNISGELLEETKDGRNQWVTESRFRKLKPLYHNELDILDWYLAGNKEFKEFKYFIDNF